MAGATQHEATSEVEEPEEGVHDAELLAQDAQQAGGEVQPPPPQNTAFVVFRAWWL